MSKVLVLGKMPRDGSPLTHFAAGPWCFTGQENYFPDWEKSFVFAPEPLGDSSRLRPAARAAQTLCVRLIPLIAEKISSSHLSFSKVYWQTLLAPWLMDVCRQIIERYIRSQAMLELWGKTSLEVPLAPVDMDFNFLDENDFSLRGGLGENYNHWLFSRILENNWPDCWQKTVAPIKEPLPERQSLSPHLALRAKIRDLLLNLPFARLKGMTLGQTLLYSRAISHALHGPDHSLDMEKAFDFSSNLDNFKLDHDLLINICLKSLPESIKKLRHLPRKKYPEKPKLKIASVAAYENSQYRQKLARWRDSGNRLGFVQHGGNYGQVAVACDTELVEYSQDIFFTWGWTNHGEAKGNFVPMPYPQLAREENKWHSENSQMIFVGAEMAAYGYRLDSRPTPLQFTSYRKDKALFFNTLGSELTSRTLYRPYFSLPGTLADADWLLPQFPELKLCHGSLLPQILGCQLLICDHHGTTMLEAFAANVPLILYWNRKHWPLTPECDKLLDMLQDCGIWHETPLLAAQKILQIWQDVPSWWNSDKIRKARAAYCKQQALLPRGNLDSQWFETLKTL